jgi:hypothetical protein
MNSNLRLALVAITLTAAVTAPAQYRHGITVDIGKNHQADTTHVTNLRSA